MPRPAWPNSRRSSRGSWPSSRRLTDVREPWLENNLSRARCSCGSYDEATEVEVAPLPELPTPAKAWRAPEGSLGKQSRAARLAARATQPPRRRDRRGLSPLSKPFASALPIPGWPAPACRATSGSTTTRALLTEGRISRCPLDTPSVFTVSLGRARDPARARHRVSHPFQLPRPGRRAHRHARALGDPHRRLGIDVAMDVPRRLRSGQRYPGQPAAYPRSPRSPGWRIRSTALPAIIAVDVWKTTPFMALLLLAGLQLIPGDVYEASTVDGASKIQQFFQITLPLLKPALLVALIFRTLDAFRVFDVIYRHEAVRPGDDDGRRLRPAATHRSVSCLGADRPPRSSSLSAFSSSSFSTRGSSGWRKCSDGQHHVDRRTSSDVRRAHRRSGHPEAKIPDRSYHRQDSLLDPDRLHPLLHPLSVLLGNRLLAHAR